MMVIWAHIAQEQRTPSPDGATTAGYIDDGGLLVRMTSEEWERCQALPDLATIRLAKRLKDIKALLAEIDTEAAP